MPRLAVHMVVDDYAKWRESFNKGTEARAKYGVANTTVYRNADNGNEVVVVADVTDAARAVEGVRSPEIREAMKRGGVKGVPSIMIANPA